MNLSDKIAIAAFAASLGSLTLAFFSYLLSRKALRLSETEHLERSLGIKPYLIDCFTFSVKENIYCAFAVSITNLSSSTKSFSNIELQVGYSFDDGECGSATAQPAFHIRPPNMAEDYRRLDPPINIPSKESVSGWVTFLRPKNEVIGFRIKEYTVVGVHNDEPVIIATAYLLRFMDNEKNEV